MRKPGYFRYGEGSISHSDEKPCPDGIGKRHPEIVRETWPSRRALFIAEHVWRPLAHFALRHHTPNWFPQYDRGPVNDYTWRGRLTGWIFSKAFPRHPEIRVGIQPADSIYER